ncbi:3-deoxy-manno-octulosonate cytidylyltransferase [Ohtaekwangia koreensis]|uniref:3-deoxy-manno-octulosonate cytidylyltransferase n=1 Tax=Ohtaekwangia koreensis TaxID=688867 RepID=A0A1T5MJT8_9BACT|nr:3-deoxy-manno-octulosonate cytidylyltransferase [Ohtaekwangia koreensis]SKC88476.1 3-deoxy-manno-octulosonate cytidylyltransferase (CMP-KDO synthetase) [Ohtaekwangia koreensis]
MRILGVIPARYASTRFPAKPLVDIAGKSMIQRVYEQVKKASGISAVVVATDNTIIFDHVKSFGGDVCMTKESHVSGTDRCFEALSLQKDIYDYVINIQGDEPFIQPSQIELLVSRLNGKTEIATLIKAIDNATQLFNPNLVKVVISKLNEALYFSRATIPHLRNIPEAEWLTKHTFYKHIGMYAYRADILQQLTILPVSSLEKAESLEQLRWLENGFKIMVAETAEETVGIDTPEDLKHALNLITSHEL